MANGNEQPILVRRVDDGFEIVSGHRRHHACSELGLPVFAVVCDEPLSDLDLFLSMVRENREREDLSPYDQGRMYVHALDSGLFASKRKLAVAVGVSHTWVRKVILIATMPVEVIQAFTSTSMPSRPRPMRRRWLCSSVAARSRDRWKSLTQGRSLAWASTWQPGA